MLGLILIRKGLWLGLGLGVKVGVGVEFSQGILKIFSMYSQGILKATIMNMHTCDYQ